MRIIDFHAHIYPEKIAEKAVKSVGEFYNVQMDGKGTSAFLEEQGKDAGISEFVVHSVAVTEKTVGTINDFIAKKCEEHKNFHGFGTMHINFNNKEEELERIEKLGLKGIKIHPDSQNYNVDDKELFEFYDLLAQKKLPLLIHCGDYRYDFSHPRRVKNILKQFPKLNVIAAHFGGWSVFDLALEYLENERCFVDTSSSFSFLGMKRAEELIKIYGPERVVFGTDYPMGNLKNEISKFLSMNFSDEENELMLYKNAERILKKEV